MLSFWKRRAQSPLVGRWLAACPRGQHSWGSVVCVSGRVCFPVLITFSCWNLAPTAQCPVCGTREADPCAALLTEHISGDKPFADLLVSQGPYITQGSALMGWGTMGRGAGRADHSGGLFWCSSPTTKVRKLLWGEDEDGKPQSHPSDAELTFLNLCDFFFFFIFLKEGMLG